MRINLRRLIPVALLAVIASSACSFVISLSGQSWETRARVIFSLLAISAHERTLPSLSSAAHKRTFATTDQGSKRVPDIWRFGGISSVVFRSVFSPSRRASRPARLCLGSLLGQPFFDPRRYERQKVFAGFSWCRRIT